MRGTQGSLRLTGQGRGMMPSSQHAHAWQERLSAAQQERASAQGERGRGEAARVRQQGLVALAHWLGHAPIMNSCMARRLPACEPPLMTFIQGTGITNCHNP